MHWPLLARILTLTLMLMLWSVQNKQNRGVGVGVGGGCNIHACMEGGVGLSLVNCPSRWSLYLSLALFLDQSQLIPTEKQVLQLVVTDFSEVAAKEAPEELATLLNICHQYRGQGSQSPTPLSLTPVIVFTLCASVFPSWVARERWK